MGASVGLTPVMLDDIAKIAYQCRIVCSANGGCGRHRPHRGLKVKSRIHCMETRELCKNSEGDPATPGLAATICWRREKEMRWRLHSLGAA